MKSFTSSTNLAKLVYLIIAVTFWIIGIKAMTDGYAAIALFSGLFSGISSTKFWQYQKAKN